MGWEVLPDFNGTIRVEAILAYLAYRVKEVDQEVAMMAESSPNPTLTWTNLNVGCTVVASIRSTQRQDRRARKEWKMT